MEDDVPFDRLARRIAPVFLRVSLGLTLIWIGGLKFADPAPVKGLLSASIPFLAADWVVYAIGVLEVAGAVLLFSGYGLRWVAVGMVVLFAGTLLIFVIAPAVSYGEAGFPFLTLAGEFLLKDLVLMAAAVALVAYGTEPGMSTTAVAA